MLGDTDPCDEGRAGHDLDDANAPMCDEADAHDDWQLLGGANAPVIPEHGVDGNDPRRKHDSNSSMRSKSKCQ